MFLAVAMTCSMPAMAQNQTVQGTVVDETGEPVIGATIKVEGTKNMAVTDFDGNYKIDVPKGGKIIVKIRPEDDVLSVEVRNTGEEIPAKDIDRIFDKFYQTDPSHATVGNGLGLSICKRIVELHKGTISVTSTFGLTVFTVNLPKI